MEDDRLLPMEEDTAEEVQEEETSIEEEDEEDEGADDNEVEEVEELIPSETTISSSIADGSADDSNVHDGKPVNDGNDGRQKGLNRGEIDVCPICFEAWTSGGDHRICCLPCGHIYGMSCIRRWILRCQSDGKCPQCKTFCALKDIRVLYATRLCVAEEMSHKTSPTKFPDTKEGFIEFQRYVSSRMDTFEQRLDSLKQQADECDSGLRFLQQRFTELQGLVQLQDNNPVV